jgi:hypothetical protein
MLSCVLIVLITLTLSMSSMGVHDHAVIGYSGILLFNALLVSRRAFILMAFLALGSGTLVFGLEFAGYTQSRVGSLTGWPALVDFLLVTGLIGALARYSAEVLFGKLEHARRNEGVDATTNLPSRPGLVLADERLRRGWVAGRGRAGTRRYRGLPPREHDRRAQAADHLARSRDE